MTISVLKVTLASLELLRTDNHHGFAVKKEVKLLQRFRHVCIVRLHSFYFETGSLNIVMEYCDGGDLFERLAMSRQSPQQFIEEEVKVVNK